MAGDGRRRDWGRGGVSLHSGGGESGGRSEKEGFEAVEACRRTRRRGEMRGWREMVEGEIRAVVAAEDA